MTLPEKIRAWAAREFAPRYVDRVTQDLIDVAAGNREGNTFERQTVAKILGAVCPQCGNTTNLETDKDQADYSCEACELSWRV
jgi:tRNA(Ile2) C34 agmatinyltransferase TiaS